MDPGRGERFERIGPRILRALTIALALLMAVPLLLSLFAPFLAEAIRGIF